MRKMNVTFYEDDHYQWRWRLRHSNGNIMADCGQGYARRIDCVDAFKSIAKHLRWGYYEMEFS